MVSYEKSSHFYNCIKGAPKNQERSFRNAYGNEHGFLGQRSTLCSTRDFDSNQNRKYGIKRDEALSSNG